LTGSGTFDLGLLTLTALDRGDSRRGRHPVPAVPGFHVVLGHAPDFALAAPPADLLLAGHVHGGQVRMPGWGPLLTLSRVPRTWAAGRTDLPGGGTLIVSRGIGLERGDAPRLRLFCRPELVVVELEPG
jgi:predicted MPP superfamily phosphohydrolase